jgi:hypothetical protein
LPHFSAVLQVSSGLEFWQRRHISTISWSAMEMLYSERQQQLYAQDADLPRWLGERCRFFCLFASLIIDLRVGLSCGAETYLLPT